MRLATKILIGLIAGVVVGLFMQGLQDIAVSYIKPFGDLFIRLIMMIIVPLVFSSLVVGAASTGDVKKLSRMGSKTIAFYLATTAFAVSMGVLLANIFKPGKGLSLPVDAVYTGREAPPLIDVLVNIIPRNPFQAVTEGSMLQIIVFALFIGVAISLVGKKADSVKNFFDGFAEIMYRITGMVMQLAPYGVFALIVPVVAMNGPSVLFPLGKVIGIMYMGAILHALIVYSFIIKGFTNLTLPEFYKGILPAQLIAFSTCSSGATLPATMKCTQENLGVSRETASFVLPLGATINMDGSALYQGIAALFVAQVYALDLSLGQQLVIVLTGTLASIGAAGVPGAGLIILTTVLASVGLPMEGIALIAGIDRILDMARTTLNITGDAVASVFIDTTEAKYSAKSS
ncbi:dicarboxylate/amino acid:cation symporter [Desulfonatronum sp. SC1]|uniref:dicarboxylate/amino acid:cation symporter n=1 Tax=Desulfonatronum sp. SC1 TaxID=2109626 RepID=UPI000D30CAA8|nr:dicarboxylate/amino acid:cation symporter [Desulfonatronum sp. SC1]PTN36754.1 dicarboxylate/amino acid:cation symporter [Desulfonatronum sp. SC1]